MNKAASKLEDVKAQLQSGREHLGYYVLDRNSVQWLVGEVDRLQAESDDLRQRLADLKNAVFTYEDTRNLAADPERYTKWLKWRSADLAYPYVKSYMNGTPGVGKSFCEYLARFKKKEKEV